ncbi:MAG: guanine deaminase [Proteobacteria bacterium]|nr:guanine deaminase [Pseudomonadota bacterium]
MEISTSFEFHRGHVAFTERLSDGSPHLRSFGDGAIGVNHSGAITYVGPWARVENYDQVKVHNWGQALLLPGFVDTHVHFPQLDILGSYGENLLGWLKRYTFPAEEKYSDRSFAEIAARRFITELFRAGTTSAAVFSSSHFGATDALFSEATRRGIRASIGQVSMNRHAPESLLTKDLALHEQEFETLRQRWHNYDEGRISIAVTPRFAPSCTDDLLRLNGDMAKTCPTALIQTHYAESKEELAWVRELFPKAKDYLNVYEAFSLVNERTILAHGIYISQDEIRRLATAKATIAHCPSSNMFLGSGIMPWKDLSPENKQKVSVKFGLGSDVGAGTSFSLWRVMGDAYKSQKLAGRSICPLELLVRATVDGANSLSPAASKPTGFQIGAPLDLQVVDWERSDLLVEKMARACTPKDLLFSLIWLWEPSMTRAVFVGGKRVFDRQVQLSC